MDIGRVAGAAVINASCHATARGPQSATVYITHISTRVTTLTHRDILVTVTETIMIPNSRGILLKSSTLLHYATSVTLLFDVS